MAAFIGMGFNFNGTTTYNGSDPGIANHGQLNTSTGHTIHYGATGIKAASLNKDGHGGVTIGLPGGDVGEGSVLQLGSFTDTQEGYVSKAAGMLLWNSTQGKLRYSNGTSWFPVGGGDEYVSAPSSSSDSGTRGQWSFDGTYLYKCVDTGTWVRHVVATDF